jgi:hypothetical protein
MKKNRFINRNGKECLWSIVILFFFMMTFASCGGGGGGGSAPALTVITVSPAAGTTEVVLNPQIQATFNKDMDSSTINTETFTLISPSGIKVSGTVSYDDTTKTVTFAPSINLAPLTTYTATVVGVKDKAGNTMNTPYSWSFTTITGFWAYDLVSNSNYFVSATIVGEGNHCVVYLEQGWTVDQNTINSIISQFDNVIYPNETSTFGSEPNPGIDNNTKIFIFLLDIKDGYTQGSSSYISGYFNPLDEHDISISPYSNQKEIFYMDINPGTPGDPVFLRTLAHEFQHMINWQQKTNLRGVYEDTWLDEAMSEIAPAVCGYGIDYEEVYGYELLPWDSLVIWNDTLYDYATVYMWAQYMKDRVTNIDGSGNGIFWNIDHTSNTGINAVNSALSAIGYDKDFTGIFGDWSIANYLGLTTISGHPEWSYTTIHTEAGYITTIGTLPGLPVDDADHINASTVGGLHMWGLDYFEFTKTGQGTVTWTKTDSTDEAAFIDTSNNTVTFNMISGNPYPYTDTGILIARNSTNTEKWTVNGGGTITRNSLLAGDRIMVPQFSKSYSNPVLEKELSAELTPKAILSRVTGDPAAKTISAKTGKPISFCIDRFFKEREKDLRRKLMKEK